MTLPLKIYYTIKEASIFLNEHLNRSDIDDSYFLQLGMKGAIRIGIFSNVDQREQTTGSIYSKFFEFDDSNAVRIAEALSSCTSALFVTGTILILNSSDVKEILFDMHDGLSSAYFDNVYSLDAQEFCIPEEIQKDFYCFQYADKLNPLLYLERVFYSKKHNEIEYIFDNERVFMTLPEVEENDDWRSGFWFNRQFGYDAVGNEDLFSDRKINKEDCLIFGEDIELLLKGQQRQKFTEHPLRQKFQINEVEIEPKINSKRANSINKIVFALANKAQLDLSNHITAYERLKRHCDINDIDLPNKDTCGNLFKSANELNKSN